VTLEDIGALETNAKKNEMIHKLITIIEKQGGKINDDFFIKLNDKGELYFADDGRKEETFKRDAYSVRSVEDLTADQLGASPKDVFDWLKFGKGSKSTSMFGIDDKYKLEEALKIMSIRYNLMMNKFEKYMPITVASDVNSKTVAAIKEYSSELPGVEVLNETYREYNDSVLRCLSLR
jgi:penicillin-binding protein 2